MADQNISTRLDTAAAAIPAQPGSVDAAREVGTASSGASIGFGSWVTGSTR